MPHAARYLSGRSPYRRTRHPFMLVSARWSTAVAHTTYVATTMYGNPDEARQLTPSGTHFLSLWQLAHRRTMEALQCFTPIKSVRKFGIGRNRIEIASIHQARSLPHVSEQSKTRQDWAESLPRSGSAAFRAGVEAMGVQGTDSHHDA